VEKLPANTETVRQMIIRLTKEAWEKRSEGTYLARLGSEVAKKYEAAVIELNGRSLSTFIKEELSKDVKLLTLPDDPLTQVAFPISAPVDSSNLQEHLVHRDPLRKAAHTSKIPGAILHAFTRPIPDGSKRFITLEPVVRFDDVDSNLPAPANSFPLEPKWIVLESTGQDAQKRSVQVMNNIASWRQSVDLAPQAITKPSAERAGSGKTLLEEFMSSLSEVDQKRIQLPLDIIAKLHSRILK
jgi:hypothetical protein